MGLVKHHGRIKIKLGASYILPESFVFEIARPNSLKGFYKEPLVKKALTYIIEGSSI